MCMKIMGLNMRFGEGNIYFDHFWTSGRLQSGAQA